MENKTMLIVVIGFVVAIVALIFSRTKATVSVAPVNGVANPITPVVQLDLGGAY